ncbi:MAG: CapA family protein, partial [Microcoleus sp.]
MACILVASTVAGFIWYGSQTPTKVIDQKIRAISKVVPRPAGVSSRMLFMGDVFWSRYINEWSQASPLKEAYPFSRLNEFDRPSYDAWIGDMECPVTDGPQLTAAEEDRLLTFNCQPKYLPEAAKWFTAMTVANNHTDGQGGDTGLDATRENLGKNGIQY